MTQIVGTITPPMTPREAEIAAAYAESWSMKDVAARLDIAPGTVKARLNRARARYGVESIGQLYVALGWLRVPRTLTGSRRPAGIGSPS
jgi:DNA-binding CsgD family transcriptional regulator